MESKGSTVPSDPYYANLSRTQRHLDHKSEAREAKEAKDTTGQRTISLRQEDVKEYEELTRECSELFASKEWAALLPKSERRVLLFPDSINALKMLSETLLYYSMEQIRKLNSASSSTTPSLSLSMSSRATGEEDYDRLIGLLNKSFVIRSRLADASSNDAKSPPYLKSDVHRQGYDLLTNKNYNHPMIHGIISEIALAYYLKGDKRSRELSKEIATELLDSIEQFCGAESDEYVDSYKKVSICQENF